MFATFKLLTNRIHCMRAFTTNILCNTDNQQKCIEKMSATAHRLPARTPTTSTEAAAVLILLVNCDKPNDIPSILYTLRSHKLSQHTRQVSFPGGKRELNDSSYADCALRETEEEIGIPRQRITIWGETSLMRFTKPLSIMPVIGSISNYDCTQLKVNKDEVERVFTVSITELCEQKKHTQFRPWAESNKKSGRFASNKSYSVPVFTVREERIWGITAMMTHLFLHSLLPAESYHHQIPYIPMFK